MSIESMRTRSCRGFKVDDTALPGRARVLKSLLVDNIRGCSKRELP